MTSTIATIEFTPIPMMPTMRSKHLLLMITVFSLLAGCAAGPDYVRPPIEAPAAYKEGAPWKAAEPKDVDSNSNWWEYYGDARLNELVVQANLANQNIRQAEAQYRRAAAVAAAARAALFPTAGVSLSATRGRTVNNNLVLENTEAAALGASWEPDLWGGIRRSIESGKAAAQASAADLVAARLAIQATLVQDYIQLRVTDLQKEMFTRTIAAYEKSVRLTQSQFNAGVAMRADVALAQTTLNSARAQAIDLDMQRAQLEHAIAILLGKAPAEFAIDPAPLTVSLPSIPSGLPSALLERRPDIAAAERRVAAANANIGVAQAAYFPSLILSGSAGAANFAQLFNTPARVWSIGATLMETVFDGGARNAQNDQAVASYDIAVAQYKQTVLNGFQEVEDNLVALSVLEQESKAQNDAVQTARDAERMTLSQYRAGTATFVAVTTAQTLALSNERAAVQLLGRQFVASVGLIKAIGGGWTAAQLENPPPMHASAETSKN